MERKYECCLYPLLEACKSITSGTTGTHTSSTHTVSHHSVSHDLLRTHWHLGSLRLGLLRRLVLGTGPSGPHMKVIAPGPGHHHGPSWKKKPKKEKTAPAPRKKTLLGRQLGKGNREEGSGLRLVAGVQKKGCIATHRRHRDREKTGKKKGKNKRLLTVQLFEGPRWQVRSVPRWARESGFTGNSRCQWGTQLGSTPESCS